MGETIVSEPNPPLENPTKFCFLFVSTVDWKSEKNIGKTKAKQRKKNLSNSINVNNFWRRAEGKTLIPTKIEAFSFVT